MGFEWKCNMRSCLFSEKHCGHGFVNSLEGAKVEGRVMVARISIQEKGGSGWEQGEKSGSGAVMLHSAYVLKVEPSGLVEGYKLLSFRGQRGQIVNISDFAGQTVSVATTQFVGSMNVAVADK